jgi:light-harvesting complex I chlorophyll a/b binding protein 1
MKMQSQGGDEYIANQVGAPFQRGVSQDTGFFDPLGLAKGGTPADLKKWRESELKHGRIAMLGVLGAIVQENFHPLFVPNEEVGPAIFHFQKIQQNFGWFPLAALFAIGLVETLTISRGWAKGEPQWGVGGGDVAPLKEEYIPGDLGFDPLGLFGDPQSANAQDLRRKELNNGRLAMIALAGLFAQELVDGAPILTHWGITSGGVENVAETYKQL